MEAMTVDEIAGALTRAKHLGFPEWAAEKNTGVTEFDAWEFVGYKPDGESMIENRVTAEASAVWYDTCEKMAKWAFDVLNGQPEPEGGER